MTITNFDLCQSSDCASLVFKDITGAYSTDSPYGYGTPNSDITDATAIVRITLADLTVHEISLDGFPTTDKTKEYKIESTDLGYDSGKSIPDQIIQIEYIVTLDDDSELIQYGEQALYCNINCCIKSMVKDIDIECDECSKSSKDKYIDALLGLAGLKYSADCGDKITFNKVLSSLQRICQNTECSNCK